MRRSAGRKSSTETVRQSPVAAPGIAQFYSGANRALLPSSHERDGQAATLLGGFVEKTLTLRCNNVAGFWTETEPMMGPIMPHWALQHRSCRKFISPADPAARWSGATVVLNKSAPGRNRMDGELTERRFSA